MHDQSELLFPSDMEKEKTNDSEVFQHIDMIEDKRIISSIQKKMMIPSNVLYTHIQA